MSTRTLIVEDDPVSQSALARLLRQVGLDVATAGSVAEARQKLGWQPQCVLLDLHLKDGSGVDILRQLRASGQPVRVAVVTGSQDHVPLAQVDGLSPDAVFIKPFPPGELIRWVTGSDEPWS